MTNDEIIITGVLIAFIVSLINIIRAMFGKNKYGYHGILGRNRGIPSWLRKDDEKTSVGPTKRRFNNLFSKYSFLLIFMILILTTIIVNLE